MTSIRANPDSTSLAGDFKMAWSGPTCDSCKATPATTSRSSTDAEYRFEVDMKTYREECEQRAKEYCISRHCEPLFNSQLGWGQEGYVWETSRRSAIKVYRDNGETNFNREFRCYSILSENDITEVHGFNVPQMIDCESRLLVIELTIVTAPYILDFGKANFRPHDFSDEVMEDYESDREELFEGNWLRVSNALSSLERFGIFYNDARPGNINCDGLPTNDD
jgi:hypothetical protein